MFKDYDIHRVQSLEEKLEAGEFLPTVSETLEIVNSARGMFNSGTFLNIN